MHACHAEEHGPQLYWTAASVLQLRSVQRDKEPRADILAALDVSEPEDGLTRPTHTIF